MHSKSLAVNGTEVNPWTAEEWGWRDEERVLLAYNYGHGRAQINAEWDSVDTNRGE